MQLHIFERIFVIGFRGDGDFLDRRSVIVAATGPHERNLRRISLARFDEEIFAHTDGLAFFDAGYVISAVRIHLHGTAINIVRAARELNHLSVIELNLAARQWAIR